MQWKVRINGDSYTLNELKRSLSNAEARIVLEKNGHYLQSKLFDTCATHEEVNDIAKNIIVVLNGATKLALGGNSAITTRSGGERER
jgi:hypothetical protein